VYAPLGLAYIAAALEVDGHSVSIIDLNSKRLSDNDLIPKLAEAQVVGIGGMVTEYNEVVRLANLAKEFTLANIILGGPLVTTHTQKVMESSYADYAVTGEGEETARELVKAIENKAGVIRVKGIAYKTFENLKTVVHINQPREPIADLDTVRFPARHLLDMSRYTTHHFKSFGLKLPYKLKSATMITSRGCMGECQFCYHEVWGRKWRGRSAENIVAEMRTLYTKGFNGFVFNDDTFVVDRKRVLKFCELLKLSGMDVKWYCNARVDLMNKELLEAMAGAGCIGIAYGIESGNQQILDAIKKHIKLEQVEKTAAETKAVGIHITGYFMLGILGDSKETIQQTLDFARKLDLDFYGFSMTSPIQGTPMHTEAMAKGLIPTQELEDWSFKASVNLTTDCTNEDLEKFNDAAFREFTIAKRYGQNYLTNPKLWFDGAKSVAFLAGKRDYKQLINKSLSVIKK
jgi:radical SAM superfamily enzyme YgiQ (UPF0313 family)